MKIGINASFLRKLDTGIGQVTVNFLETLIKEYGHLEEKKQRPEFYIYLEEDIDLDLPDNFHKIVFHPIYSRDDLIRKIWWEKFSLPRKVKYDECDVFISLYQSATILPDRIRHMMVVHDIIPKLFPEYLDNSRKKLYDNLVEKAMRKVRKIIAVSHRTEKDLVQIMGMDPAKITVSNIDVDEIYKKEVKAEDSSRVMKKYELDPGYIYSGGGLEKRKNIDGVLLAYKSLYEKNKNEKFTQNFPKLVISGKMMPQLAPLVTDVEKLVEEFDLSAQVRLLDFVPQNDLPALYKNCLYFIYPSLYEGFGMPVLEAMSQGKPIIASKKSSLPEVGGDSVLYCDPGDKDDIEMVMKKLLKDGELREILSKRAKSRSQNFSWDKFTQKAINIAKNK